MKRYVFLFGLFTLLMVSGCTDSTNSQANTDSQSSESDDILEKFLDTLKNDGQASACQFIKDICDVMEGKACAIYQEHCTNPSLDNSPDEDPPSSNPVPATEPPGITSKPMAMGPFPPEILNSKNFWNVKQEPFNAKGDGVTDDTSAIQKLMTQVKLRVNEIDNDSTLYRELPSVQVIYFPNGVYKITDKLSFGTSTTKDIVILGESKQNTIIKLSDHNSTFQNESSPKPVLTFYEGESSSNTSFQNYILNITVDVGQGNPGTVGIEFHNNNSGRIENVLIKTSDSSYKGKIGLKIHRGAAGLGLIKNVKVIGFDDGISIQNPIITYTFEHIELINQKRAGIRVSEKPVQIRKLYSDQSAFGAPAIVNENKMGQIVVLDSTLTNGASTHCAIENNNGHIFIRNVSTEGYQAALKDHGTVISGNVIAEYLYDKAYTLWDNIPPQSLNLPIKDTPIVPWDDFKDWAIVDVEGVPKNRHSDEIQKAIDSGKSTIYLKSGVYWPDKTIYIRGNVRRIHGGWSKIRPADSLVQSANPVWQIETGNHPNMVMECFHRLNPPGTKGWYIQNNSAKTVILKDLSIPNRVIPYRNQANAGDLFIEQVTSHAGGDMTKRDTFVFNKQNVWIRNINPEGYFPHLTNLGGVVWILGYKVGEWHGPWFVNKNGGKLEVLGGLMNAQDFNHSEPSKDTAAIINDNSDMSLIGVERIRSQAGSHPVMIREIQGNETREFKHSQFPLRGYNDARVIPLYIGKKDAK